MWKEASKEMDRAGKIAKGYDASIDELNLISDQVYYHARSGNRSSLKKFISNWDANTSLLMDEISSRLSYDKLFMEVNLLNSELEAIRTPQDEARIEKFLKHPLLKKPRYGTSSHAELNFNYCKGIAFYLLGNYTDAFKCMDSALMIIKDNELLKAKREELLLRLKANLVLISIQLFELDQAEIYLDQLIAYKTADKTLNSYQLYMIYLMKLILLTTKKDFRAAINLINKQKSNSSNLFNTINDKSAMTQEQVYELFYTAACYMGVNRHKKAMGLLYDFISEEKNLTKRDAYTTARFFYLIVLIEINDDGLINSELRSLQRFLKSEKKL